MPGKQWSPMDRYGAMKMLKEGYTAAEVGEAYGRSAQAVRDMKYREKKRREAQARGRPTGWGRSS